MSCADKRFRNFVRWNVQNRRLLLSKKQIIMLTCILIENNLGVFAWICPAFHWIWKFLYQHCTHSWSLLCTLNVSLLFRDYDDFKCVSNRVGNDVASDFGSSWLHASQRSALSPWQIGAAGLATFIHICVGSIICFLSHDDANSTARHRTDFDKKACDAVYLQSGDAL